VTFAVLRFFIPSWYKSPLESLPVFVYNESGWSLICRNASGGACAAALLGVGAGCFSIYVMIPYLKEETHEIHC
ncbi:MAG: hypothetical protein KAX26_14415, partial [Anaerolineae bacterium]|nr:hypothetical protein [Anaerolineae bacterium]